MWEQQTGMSVNTPASWSVWAGSLARVNTFKCCSPEVEYLMISCRPHCLPREFSSVFFVAVYIPPQTESGTKTALNELYSAISKQENAHPEAALLVAGDFNVGKLKYQHVKCATRGEKTLNHLYSTHTLKQITQKIHESTSCSGRLCDHALLSRCD